MNIYVGPRSAYARREGAYVPGRGVSMKTAPGIIALLLRDLKRRRTYDHSGRTIPMTRRLFYKRMLYLIVLAKRHRGLREALQVARLVRYALRHHRLPPGTPLSLEGPRARQVMRELVAMGIVAEAPLVAPRIRIPTHVRKKMGVRA